VPSWNRDGSHWESWLESPAARIDSLVEQIRSVLSEEAAEALGALLDEVRDAIDGVLPIEVDRLDLTNSMNIGGDGTALANLIGGRDGDIAHRFAGNDGADVFDFHAAGQGVPTITEFALAADLRWISPGHEVPLVPGSSAMDQAMDATSCFVFSEIAMSGDPAFGSGADPAALIKFPNASSPLPDCHLM
jgi:hypothetical protein